MKTKTTTSSIRRLRTEQSNDAAHDLDRESSPEIARIINREDATVAPAVNRALPQIARAIDLAAAALRNGGRLIYVGAGTSGRIAALDAVECPPTFSTDRVQFIIAGGPKALAADSEISEDDSKQGREQMARRRPGKDDVILGIASSGRIRSQSPPSPKPAGAGHAPSLSPATASRLSNAPPISPSLLRSVPKCSLVRPA